MADGSALDGEVLGHYYDRTTVDATGPGHQPVGGEGSFPAGMVAAGKRTVLCK